MKVEINITSKRRDQCDRGEMQHEPQIFKYKTGSSLFHQGALSFESFTIFRHMTRRRDTKNVFYEKLIINLLHVSVVAFSTAEADQITGQNKQPPSWFHGWKSKLILKKREKKSFQVPSKIYWSCEMRTSKKYKQYFFPSFCLKGKRYWKYNLLLLFLLPPSW